MFNKLRPREPDSITAGCPIFIESHLGSDHPMRWLYYGPTVSPPQSNRLALRSLFFTGLTFGTTACASHSNLSFGRLPTLLCHWFHFDSCHDSKAGGVCGRYSDPRFRLEQATVQKHSFIVPRDRVSVQFNSFSVGPRWQSGPSFALARCCPRRPRPPLRGSGSGGGFISSQ